MCVCVCAHVRARSVMFDSLQPHGLPGSSVCKSFKARILERVSVSYSRGSSSPRNQTCVSCVFCIGGQILYCYITWEVSPPPKKKKKTMKRQSELILKDSQTHNILSTEVVEADMAMKIAVNWDVCYDRWRD